MDSFIETLPILEKMKVLKIAKEQNLKEGDPAWLLIQAIFDGALLTYHHNDAAKRTEMALIEFQKSLDKVQDRVEMGASSAASKMTEILSNEIDIKAQLVTNSMVNAIRDVSTKIPAAAQKHRQSILDEWRSQLALTAKEHKKTESFVAKISFGVFLILFMLLGGGILFLLQKVGWVPLPSHLSL